MCFMSMHYIKKILKFAHFRAELQSKIIRAFAHNSVIFGPNSIFFYIAANVSPISANLYLKSHYLRQKSTTPPSTPNQVCRNVAETAKETQNVNRYYQLKSYVITAETCAVNGTNYLQNLIMLNLAFIPRFILRNWSFTLQISPPYHIVLLSMEYQETWHFI